MSAPRRSFFAELQRRRVYKAGATYAVAGWLLVQIVTQVFPVFEISSLAQRIVVLAVVCGFPVALLLAWLFDLTPQGIVLTDTLPPAGESALGLNQRRTIDRRLNYVLGLLVLLGLAYIGAERSGYVGRPRAPAGAMPGAKAIAVLPFDNLSDDPSNAYFAIGIQDEILTRLAGINDLKVISRTSTEKYKSHPDNLKTVAAELGVGRLLEGSVQKAGARVRVNVQLIDALTDTHLWANTYDRELKDVFAVESEISQDIADTLKAKLSPDEASALAKAPTANPAAYDLFLKAEYGLHKATDSNRDADFVQAEALYRQALALDPGFALARAQLAYCMLSRQWFGTALTRAELAEVKELTDRAIAAAPDLPEAHEAAGYYHYWGFRDYASAKLEFRRALELRPNDAQTIAAAGFIQRRQGEWAAAAATLGKAIAYAPRDNGLIGNYGQTYTVMRRYDDAERALRRSIAIDPDDMQSRSYLAINALMRSGDVQTALALFADLPPDRRASITNADGDVLNVVNARFYAYVFGRRFDEALQAWPAPAAETTQQRIERMSARVAIQMLAGRRASMQAECNTLSGLLIAKQKAEGDAFQMSSALSWTDLCLGREADALREARRGAELLPLSKDAWSGTYLVNGLAQIDTQTGHFDEALKLIAQLLAMPAGDSMSIARLRLDPVWDPLRKDPRFQKLIDEGTEARL